jgi:hypothetical protein
MMNDPDSPQPIRSVTPPGDRSPETVAEPVHSVAFKTSSSDAQRPPTAHQENGRGWILAGLLVLLIGGGGWILHHLRQHPVLPLAVTPYQPAPRTPAVPAKAEVPPGRISGAPQPSVLPTNASTAEDPTDARARPAAVVDADQETGGQPGRQASVPERVDAAAGTQPGATRKHFRNLLSQGLAAMHSRQYRQARDTLQQAAAIDPQSDEVREALNQVDHALKLAQLDRLQRLATAAEKNARWSKAQELYLAALAIDPNVGFALRGMQYTINRITIDKRIAFYLNQPETLFNDRHLDNAVQLLLDAEKVEPQDPDLAAKLKDLDQLVTASQTPVRITITSDNHTDVVLYKVGRLGRFGTHDLSLRPGPYTVVGVRDGYRDVRLNFTVKPGKSPSVVHVACKEKVR